MTNSLQATTQFLGHDETPISCSIYAKINFMIICDAAELKMIESVLFANVACQDKIAFNSWGNSDINHESFVAQGEQRGGKNIQVLQTAPHGIIQCPSSCTNCPYTQKWSSHSPRREGLPFQMRCALLMLCQITGLNFQCCGQVTTRVFIVHDRLPSAEEQKLFWAHEAQGRRLSCSRRGWPLNERGRPVTWPRLISWCHRKWTYPYQGSKLKSSKLRFSSDVTWWSFRTGTRLSPWAYTGTCYSSFFLTVQQKISVWE